MWVEIFIFLLAGILDSAYPSWIEVLDQYSNASTFVTSTQLNDTACCGVETVNTGKSAYPSWIEVLDQYSNASILKESFISKQFTTKA